MLRRIAVALALVAVGAGALAAAAWVGLVPGVQLRQRPTPQDETAGEPPTRVSDTADAPPPELGAPVEPARDTTRLASSADDADAPTSLSTADVTTGDALYRGAGRCAGCHGSAGEGVAGLGPSLADGVWLHGSSQAAIRRVTAEGAAPPLGGYGVAMPAYGAQLGPEQLTQLAAYVWALSHPGAVGPDSTALRPTVPAIAPDPSPAPATRPTVPPP